MISVGWGLHAHSTSYMWFPNKKSDNENIASDSKRNFADDHLKQTNINTGAI